MSTEFSRIFRDALEAGTPGFFADVKMGANSTFYFELFRGVEDYKGTIKMQERLSFPDEVKANYTKPIPPLPVRDIDNLLHDAGYARYDYVLSNIDAEWVVRIGRLNERKIAIWAKSFEGKTAVELKNMIEKESKYEAAGVLLAKAVIAITGQSIVDRIGTRADLLPQNPSAWFAHDYRLMMRTPKLPMDEIKNAVKLASEAVERGGEAYDFYSAGIAAGYATPTLWPFGY